MNIEERKQQMQEILKDTVDYYREDPKGRRAVDNCGDCEYTTEDGRHCAIGRYMKPEFQKISFSENSGIGVNGLAECVDNYLVKDVHGLELLFWRDLQDMHDIASYWEEWSKDVDGLRKHKLTDRGKETYVGMQDKITRGEYDV